MRTLTRWAGLVLGMLLFAVPVSAQIMAIPTPPFSAFGRGMVVQPNATDERTYLGVSASNADVDAIGTANPTTGDMIWWSAGSTVGKIASTTYGRTFPTFADANHARPALTLGWFNVKDHPYHAVGDGIADDSVAFQATFDAALAAGGGVIWIPPGTWIAEVLLDDANPNLKKYKILGAGGGFTTWKAKTAGHFALTITGSPSFSNILSIQGVKFDGNSNTTGGISTTVNDTSSMHLIDCPFTNCTYGWKNTGSIWWRFDFCTATNCDFGWWTKGTATMHAGCGELNQCNAYMCNNAGIYINGYSSSNSMQQITIRGGIFESCGGFAIYAKNTSVSHPLIIDNIYVENNGTAANVHIDDETFVHINPAGQRFDHCPRVILSNSDQSYGIDVNDSNAVIENPYLYNNGTGDPNVTNGGSVEFHDVYLDQWGRKFRTDVAKYAPVTTGRIDGHVAATVMNTCRVPIRQNYVSDVTNLWVNGSMQTDFTLTDPNGMTYSFVGSGAPGGGRYLKVRIQPCPLWHEGVVLFPDYSTTSGKFIMWSFDIRSDANDILIKMTNVNNGGIDCNVPVVASEWRRFYGWTLGNYSGVRDTAYEVVINPATTYETIHLANMQCVEFVSKEEMLQYIEAGSYTVTGSGLPVNGIINASGTCDPNNMATAATDEETILAPGAALGDTVLPPAAPYSLAGIMATAYVESAGKVKVRMYNPTAGAINLASGTWKIKILK